MMSNTVSYDLILELTAYDSLKAGYDSCMDEKYNEKHGLASIKKIIAQYGPWPLDGKSWNKATWNFKKTMHDVTSHLPITAFFKVFVSLDSKNPDSHAYHVCIGS